MSYMVGPSTHSELPPSSADKWFNCHAWRRLTWGLPNPSSAAAEEGTLAHEWLAEHLLGIKGLEELDDQTMYDHLIPCAEWAEEQPGEMHVEIRLDYGGAFGYEGLGGTSDLVFDHPKHLTIGDLKYGRGFVEVIRNLQLMVYLVGAIHKFGRRPRYRLVILQPRAYDERGPIREWWIDDEAVVQFEGELEAAIKASYNPKSQPKVGEYCRKFCLALGRCPAAARHSLSLLAEADDDY